MRAAASNADAAERMIALGFFEPAIERFPTEALRERAAQRARGKADA